MHSDCNYRRIFCEYVPHYIYFMERRCVYVSGCNRKTLQWKEGRHRKQLIIEGARQVGKTWLMKEFGSKAYDDIVYINFDSNSGMAELFASDLNTDRLLMGMERYGQPVSVLLWRTTKKRIDYNNKDDIMYLYIKYI